jgi:hypothetical protein
MRSEAEAMTLMFDIDVCGKEGEGKSNKDMFVCLFEHGVKMELEFGDEEERVNVSKGTTHHSGIRTSGWRRDERKGWY